MNIEKDRKKEKDIFQHINCRYLNEPFQSRNESIITSHRRGNVKFINKSQNFEINMLSKQSDSI